MICVLRIGGRTLDVAALRNDGALIPYRIDQSGVKGATVNCAYYNVVTEETGSKSRFVSSIELFLIENKSFLQKVGQIEGVEIKDLDIGLMLKQPALSTSIEIRSALIKIMDELGFSLSLTTYLTKDGD